MIKFQEDQLLLFSIDMMKDGYFSIDNSPCFYSHLHLSPYFSSSFPCRYIKKKKVNCKLQ